MHKKMKHCFFGDKQQLWIAFDLCWYHYPKFIFLLTLPCSGWYLYLVYVYIHRWYKVSLLRGLASQELCFRLTSQVLTSLQLGGPESIDVIVECLLLGFIKAKFDVIIWVARLSQSVVCPTHKQLRK